MRADIDCIICKTDSKTAYRAGNVAELEIGAVVYVVALLAAPSTLIGNGFAVTAYSTAKPVIAEQIMPPMIKPKVNFFMEIPPSWVLYTETAEISRTRFSDIFVYSKSR